MKKQLVVFAMLLLISTAMKAQIIEVSTESLTEFAYAEGKGPSAPQSFLISVSGLTEGLDISFQGFQPVKFEISREEEGVFENQLSIPIEELGDEVDIEQIDKSGSLIITFDLVKYSRRYKQDITHI